ncbi:hypothetical protein [Acinetobacter rathckeae]|uniref:hypothetical protein n=1 Tax=Acinetobacter rathckeae TaxID=2605272 RepID=UPI0018A31261|nr:hypothetical protein [Acinetobacter rathckeae]MBF7687250.1 hypothetical protein [Acinetobacter rathckeae]MBF7694397.1 hypothetical protein [Acinetobacter rathckeae]
MKKILVVLNQANITQLQTLESLSATLVFATFGHEVSVLLQDAAISLLGPKAQFNTQQHAFKFASNLVESFELYDIEHIYIEQQQTDHPFAQNTQINVQPIVFDATFIHSFDQVIYW